MKIVIKIIFLTFLAVPASAQVDTLWADSLRVDSTMVDSSAASSPVRVDSVLFIPELDNSPGKRVENPVDFERHLSQNPTAALFKSMLVPGLGQIGNHRYIKAGFFIGLETWFIVSAIHFGKQANYYREEYEAADEDDLIARRYNYTLYEDRRDNRNKFTWFAGITVFISMFDAYVDAHLSGSPYNNDDGDRLKLDVQPDVKGGARAVVSFSF
ncbi:MAG: hypothetical protein JXA92_04310 [candidate division Zixibacteria bacterium]|nr:hypothetical protein [candidate division Zixibacteria bacterium]